MKNKKLYRSDKNKIVAGILGGIGEYIGIDPVVVRVAFLALTIFTGVIPGIIFYVLAFFVVPAKSINRDE